MFLARAISSPPMVWGLCPQSKQRTLEEMDLLFAADTPWVWDAEKNFAKLTEQHPGLVSAARRGSSVVDPESGVGGTRRMRSVARVASLEIRQEGALKN